MNKILTVIGIILFIAIMFLFALFRGVPFGIEGYFERAFSTSNVLWTAAIVIISIIIVGIGYLVRSAIRKVLSGSSDTSN